MSSDDPSSTFALAFAILGGLFALIAVGMVMWRRAFLARAQRIEGVVVDHTTSKRGSGAQRRTVYHPVVRFSLTGVSHQVAGAVGYDTPRPNGKQVFVLIDPTSPKTALLDEFPDKWSTVVMSVVVSIIFFSASAAALALS